VVPTESEVYMRRISEPLMMNVDFVPYLFRVKGIAKLYIRFDELRVETTNKRSVGYTLFCVLNMPL
jgi:hypothetical protein